VATSLVWKNPSQGRPETTALTGEDGAEWFAAFFVQMGKPVEQEKPYFASRGGVRLGVGIYDDGHLN